MKPNLAASHRLIHFEEIDSTNAEAHRLAEAGERGPLWIWADRQSRGRGRHGRNWVSEPGNLYATFLFSIAGTPALASQISFVAALAVLDMTREMLTSNYSSCRRKPGPNSPGDDSRSSANLSMVEMGPGLRRDDDENYLLSLKWPNDVLLDGRKFSGILPEAIGRPDGDGTVIALGCGINIAHAPSGTPYPVTSLALHGVSASVIHCLEALSHAMARRLEIWDSGNGFAAIREAWLAHAIGLGGPVTTGDVSGIFSGLAPDGALIVTLPSGATRRIHAGEVRFAALERLRTAS